MNLLWMLFIFLGHQNVIFRASLVVQWLRIHLPMQGTQVPSSVGGSHILSLRHQSFKSAQESFAPNVA